jgi:protein involved in polysaccharide export with SLBB domain
MAMTKVGQIWGRVCIVSCLLLTGLLFAGCQTNSGDAGFSEVPGVEPPAQGGTAPGNPAVTPTVVPSAVATTNRESGEFIKVGDILVITFADLPPPPPPPFDQKVRDDGTVTLIYNQPFQAAGKRTGDLEREIRAFYVPSYFKNLTVTVRITADRFYYVDGEVRMASKLPYTSGMTVSKAIAAAGGFNDFANKRKVKLIRGDRTQTINCNDVLNHPEKDPLVLPDDRIHVPRRIIW